MKQPSMNYKGLSTKKISSREKMYIEKEFNTGSFESDKKKYLEEKEKLKKSIADYKKSKVNELDTEGSNHSVGIIVPSTKNGNEAISKKEFVERVADTKKEMSNLFGGTTSIEQVGSYTLANGSLVEEKGVAVVSNTDKEKFEENKHKILGYAKSKGKEWTQESMGVTKETPKHPSKSLHFIETKN